MLITKFLFQLPYAEVLVLFFPPLLLDLDGKTTELVFRYM